MYEILHKRIDHIDGFSGLQIMIHNFPASNFKSFVGLFVPH